MREDVQRFQSYVFLCVFFVTFIVTILFFKFVLTPLIAALVLAYLINPVMEKLEARGFKRLTLLLMGVFFLMLLLFLVLWFLLPILFQEIEILFNSLPNFMIFIQSNLIPKVYNFVKQVVGPAIKLPQVIHLSDIVPDFLDKPLNIFLGSVRRSTQILLSWSVPTFLAPFFFFLFVKDFQHIRRLLEDVIPPLYRVGIFRFLTHIDNTLRSVVKGQLLIVLILSLLYSTAFAVAGLPAGVVIGLITGVARLVPFLDVLIGGSLCFFVLVTNASPFGVIMSVIISFIAIQLFDGLFLTPRIIGHVAGLHPFLLIVSVLCFGDWFGFYGVLLAIPTTAVANVVIQSMFEVYKKSDFYNSNKAF